MCTPHDTQDAHRHANLTQLGQMLTLPARADAARQARWQSAVLAAAAEDTAPADSHPKRRRHRALFTSGAAAAVLIALLLTSGRNHSVSAATILGGLKAAIAQSLVINIAGLDLGSVAIDGDIYVDRAATGADDAARYAEVHVRLRADNEEWNDLDGVLVICDTPDVAWEFCRGNGGWITDTPQVTPTEQFCPTQRSWHDFRAAPLDQFNSLPYRLRFTCRNSSVTYSFTGQQRMLVERVLQYLLDLSDPVSAATLLDDLLASAGAVHLECLDASIYVLHAAQLRRLGPLDLTAVSPAGLPTLSVRYDDVTGRVQRAEFRGVGAPESCLTLELGPVSLPTERLVAEHWLTPETERCDGE